MKLKSFNYILGLIIIFFCSPLLSEEKIDIWKNNKNTKEQSSNLKKEEDIKEKINIEPSQTVQSIDKIQIQESASIKSEEQKIYGIYEPASYNFDLNMWSTTKAEDLRSSLKRLSKIELSSSSSEILEAILFSFSYPPKGMSEKEFVDLKINW